MNYQWDTQFTDLFTRCLAKYNSGDTDFENYYSKDDLDFLADIGYKTREFFDFVEDNGDSNGTEPTLSTAVLVAGVRRDFFHVIQNKQLETSAVLTPDQLPGKTEELGGFTWLPRIIAKARGKLQGILDPEIMFCCGGDRAFLRNHDIHPADFLRSVWAAREEDGQIVAYVRDVSSA